jgi:glyoxylase-like metal-dependent hydrolase (beta-lactamase superfamily II)
MKKRMFLGVVLASSLLFAQGPSAQTPEQQIVADAAAALGGRDRVLAVKTLAIDGGGHDMSIGQSRRFDELGLQSDVNQIRDFRRVYDLTNLRGRFEATREAQYPFYLGEGGARQVQALDGDVAFNIAPNGTPTRVFGPQAVVRRVEYLRHPLTIVRVALGQAARLANARTQGVERLVDVTSGSATVTLAIDGTTKLPTRVVWMTDNPTLGDYAIETRFGDYRSVNGVQLPTLFTTKTDRFESAVVRITRLAVDENAGNLAAPAEIASAAAPASPPTEFPVEAQEIAKGLWFVLGTTHHSLLAEFGDHLMLIEAPNEERTLRVLSKARELRPNKPVTKLLVTHHHADHTSGLRTAVAEGVTEIVTHRTNVAYVNEVLKRPHTINPDRLSKKPNSKPVKITAVDDEGVVKDGTMTINLYHILDNSHSDSMLMLYFPNGRIVTQSDVYMPNDKRNIIEGEPLGHAPWLRNFLANINFRKLQIDYHAPIHGDYVPHSQFLESVITMTQFVAGRGSTN